MYCPWCGSAVRVNAPSPTATSPSAECGFCGWYGRVAEEVQEISIAKAPAQVKKIKGCPRCGGVSKADGKLCADCVIDLTFVTSQPGRLV